MSLPRKIFLTVAFVGTVVMTAIALMSADDVPPLPAAAEVPADEQRWVQAQAQRSAEQEEAAFHRLASAERERAAQEAEEAVAHERAHEAARRAKASRRTEERASRAPAAPAPGSNYERFLRLADCETGDRYRDAAGKLRFVPGSARWDANTGNGYYGGLQFLADTWRRAGGTGLPHQHSRDTQIAIAESWLARTSWSQWPACSRALGYR